MKQIVMAGLIGLMLGTTPGYLQAQVPLGGMIMVGDFERIRELASAYGPAELREDEDGHYVHAEMDGAIYTISFLNCGDTGTACTTLQFRAWWENDGTHSIEMMNQWNRDRRFSSAYLNPTNDPTIEWDVNLTGGITAANFDDSLQWWELVLRQFEDEVIQHSAAPVAPEAPMK